MQMLQVNFCNSSPGLSNGHVARFAAECRKMLAQRRTPGGLAPPLGPQSKIPPTKFSAFPSRTRRRSPRCCTRCLLVAISTFARDLYLAKFWPSPGRAVSFGGPSLRSSPAATRRRRPEGTAVSRFEDALWAVRAARSSRTAVPRPPAAAKYRQLLMHAVCASAGSSHCMIAPHQRLQVRSRWLFRPGQRSSGCGVLQKQGRRRVFGHTQAPVSPEPRGDVHESEAGCLSYSEIRDSNGQSLAGGLSKIV